MARNRACADPSTAKSELGYQLERVECPHRRRRPYGKWGQQRAREQEQEEAQQVQQAQELDAHQRRLPVHLQAQQLVPHRGRARARPAESALPVVHLPPLPHHQLDQASVEHRERRQECPQSAHLPHNQRADHPSRRTCPADLAQR